jgi:hypothetical protein
MGKNDKEIDIGNIEMQKSWEKKRIIRKKLRMEN